MMPFFWCYNTVMNGATALVAGIVVVAVAAGVALLILVPPSNEMAFQPTPAPAPPAARPLPEPTPLPPAPPKAAPAPLPTPPTPVQPPAAATPPAAPTTPPAPSDQPKTIHVAIRNYSFVPALVTVNPGDTVVFTNEDPVTHTATASGGAFDTGFLELNQTHAVTLIQPGQYGYFCLPHPGMKGTIVVQ
jgi:plastocyanin